MYRFFGSSKQRVRLMSRAQRRNRNEAHFAPQRLPNDVRVSIATLQNRFVSGQSKRDNNDKHSKNAAEKSDSKREVSTWYQQIQSPPNIITISRIACTPLLSYWIMTGEYNYALVGCFVAGLSDGVDGYLAKNYNMKTRLGTYLDPIADKILINTLSVSLWMTGALPSPLVGLWFAKDIALLTGTAYVVVVKDEEQAIEVQPTRTAKFSTALQFATIGSGIILPLYPNIEPTLEVLCWMTGVSTIASGLSYMDMHAFSNKK